MNNYNIFMQHYLLTTHHPWVVFSLVLFFALFAGSCSTEPIPAPLPPQRAHARYLLVVVHGSGDTAADWPADILKRVADVIGHQELWDFVAYDWSSAAADKATAARTGLAIGEALGKQLASEDYSYERIQLIGHSVGAFVVQGICDAYCQHKAHGAWLHLTFLDPFTGYGLFDWAYGKRRFGTGSDFAEAYINTDDPVPSTNGFLQAAHNFDISAQAPPTLSDRERHWWPVHYYRDSIGAAGEQYGYALSLMAAGEGAPYEQSQFPAGATTIVP